ncbi:PREDICTED: uncharacterized protein At1g05835-like [Tarenaya hassleriana]|uniref:uncharacterized protein At1g05835-like n=1 Tax=Tarenaya hassleriana TaxID=28532 RepID=UPI00053C737C|nr:PREDICTED: uncharacterized protein At1g05835-like isoform X1 [Tarenaya hassleriana]XP_010546545.1 PREDICTED: uncharacterized protein At1g05835-like isoform X2 [Tarenaya hassleriana]XP_010546547.1 PREDICTED: uncharacterized protein At1g05835-like [Tarenaya hassleriana]
MANACKLLALVLFFALVAKGYGQCSVDNLSLGQAKTGQTVNGKPEWKVSVKNPCPCTVMNLKLSCVGFQSTSSIDSSVMSKSGDECLLNGGSPLAPMSVFSFNYAWDSSFDLTILSGQPHCS